MDSYESGKEDLEVCGDFLLNFDSDLTFNSWRLSGKELDLMERDC